MLGKLEQVTCADGIWGNRRWETVIPNCNLTKRMNQHLGREVPELPVPRSSAWLIRSPILVTLWKIHWHLQIFLLIGNTSNCTASKSPWRIQGLSRTGWPINCFSDCRPQLYIPRVPWRLYASWGQGFDSFTHSIHDAFIHLPAHLFLPLTNTYLYPCGNLFLLHAVVLKQGHFFPSIPPGKHLQIYPPVLTTG